MTGAARILWVWVWVGVVLAAAPALRVAAAEEYETDVTDVGGRKIVSLKIDGEWVPRVTPKDLEDAKVAGWSVCLEGKFGDQSAPDTFSLLGDGGAFVCADKDLLAKLKRGDNIFIVGIAAKFKDRGGCYVSVKAIKPLKSDAELFEERLAAFAKKGDAARLMELAEWVKGLPRKDSSIGFDKYESYNQLARRAYGGALEALEGRLAPGDAAGRLELARKCISLAGDRVRAKRLFAECLKLDPGNAAATMELSGMGMVLHGGEWITPAERERLLAEKKKELLAQKLQVGREERLAGVRRAAPETLPELVRDEPDEQIVREIVWRLAALADEKALDSLIEVLSIAQQPEARRDCIDAIARAALEKGWKAISEIGGKETDEMVRLHAALALAEAGDNYLPQARQLLAGIDVKRLTAESEFYRRWWERSGKKLQ